jgi:molecular chaperone GrpE
MSPDMAPRPDLTGGTGPGGRRVGDAHSTEGPEASPGSDDRDLSEAAEAASAEIVEEDLNEILDSARRERDEYLDMLRRVQADFENYKKRMMRQQTELLERAARDLIDKLLPSLDAFELAREHLAVAPEMSEEGKALLQASALLFDTLSKEGLERVDDLGATFDPTMHDAVDHEEGPPQAEGQMVGAGSAETAEGSTASSPVVVGVLRPGYRWKGRVIRPAMVRVRG